MVQAGAAKAPLFASWLLLRPAKEYKRWPDRSMVLRDTSAGAGAVWRGGGRKSWQRTGKTLKPSGSNY